MATSMHDAAHEQRAISSRVEAIGRTLARYGLVLVVAWIGLMKVTAYEAEGIRQFVANSPLMSWVYEPLSVRGFSAALGASSSPLPQPGADPGGDRLGRVRKLLREFAEAGDPGRRLELAANYGVTYSSDWVAGLTSRYNLK
jgi:hypothetical protein